MIRGMDDFPTTGPCPFTAFGGDRCEISGIVTGHHVSSHHVVVEEKRSPVIAAASAFAFLTAVEVLLIISGYGWWVLPVAMIVAAFCVGFVCTSWEMFREITKMFREAAPTHPRREKAAPLVVGEHVIPPIAPRRGKHD